MLYIVLRAETHISHMQKRNRSNSLLLAYLLITALITKFSNFTIDYFTPRGMIQSVMVTVILHTTGIRLRPFVITIIITE